MALKIKSIKNVRWEYSPWELTVDINVVGTVPASQDYCPDTDVHNPDYTIAYLELQPIVGVLCKDTTERTGNANARLGNIEWYEIKGGTRTKITAETPGYDITGCAEGSATSGRILIKKNVMPSEPVTLEFNATLLDSRLGETHTIRKTFGLRSVASWAEPTLMLDCSSVISYYPVRDAATQRITASLNLGGVPCPVANRLFVWEVWRDRYSRWDAIGSDETDYWATVSADTSVMTLNREFMGQGQRVRCRAKYDRDGNPSSITLMNSAPSAEFRAERVMRNLSLVDNLGISIPTGTGQVYAEAILSDGNGRIPTSKVNEYFDVQWKTVANSATLNNPIYATVARGAQAYISTSMMNAQYGMQTMCEVEDLGPLEAWADEDGTLIADEDGQILLIK